MKKKHPNDYSLVFKMLNQKRVNETTYSISYESDNIKELKKLSDQIREPEPITYSFSK